MERVKAAMTRQDAAGVLGVTLRTVRNWESGHSRVPYSAFKLLRILGGYALPGRAWRGFYLRGNTIWSPEGKSFQAADLAWWSLTVAMARNWREMRERQRTTALQRPPLVPPLPCPSPSLPLPNGLGFQLAPVNVMPPAADRLGVMRSRHKKDLRGEFCIVKNGKRRGGSAQRDQPAP